GPAADGAARTALVRRRPRAWRASRPPSTRSHGRAPEAEDERRQARCRSDARAGGAAPAPRACLRALEAGGLRVLLLARPAATSPQRPAPRDGQGCRKGEAREGQARADDARPAALVRLAPDRAGARRRLRQPPARAREPGDDAAGLRLGVRSRPQ